MLKELGKNGLHEWKKESEQRWTYDKQMNGKSIAEKYKNRVKKKSLDRL